MARTIDRPMGLRGTFYRIKVIEMTTWGERIDRGYHNQPFRTRDEAEAAIWRLSGRSGTGWPRLARRPTCTSLSSGASSPSPGERRDEMYQRMAMNAETPRPVYARGADGRYSVEASELRFRPGEWPMATSLNTAEYGPVTFGRHPFDGTGLIDVERDPEGDIVAVHYYGPMGIHLVVWND